MSTPRNGENTSFVGKAGSGREVSESMEQRVIIKVPRLCVTDKTPEITLKRRRLLSLAF